MDDVEEEKEHLERKRKKMVQRRRGRGQSVVALASPAVYHPSMRGWAVTRGTEIPGSLDRSPLINDIAACSHINATSHGSQPSAVCSVRVDCLILPRVALHVDITRPSNPPRLFNRQFQLPSRPSCQWRSERSCYASSHTARKLPFTNCYLFSRTYFDCHVNELAAAWTSPLHGCLFSGH